MCAPVIFYLLLPGEFIIGRVIKAMNNSWHPDCFCCDLCQAVLADVGFVKNAGRSVQRLGLDDLSAITDLTPGDSNFSTL